MATVLSLPAERRQHAPGPAAGRDTALVLGCAALAVLLLGYHPAAEDGGIYAAAAALRLQPGLFPAEHGFAVAQGGRSLFVPLLALLTRLLHLPLGPVLFGCYVLSTAATVAAARVLVRVVLLPEGMQRGALLLFAVSLGLPVAGTSLYLADPYLTGRSLATPLLLLALAAAVQRRSGRAAVCVALTFAVHPIMALCAVPLFAALFACRSVQRTRAVLLFSVGVALTMLVLLWLGPAETAAARAASMTRAYWFPARWAWYEWLGAVAPPTLLLLLLLQRSLAGVLTAGGRDLLRAASLSTAVVLTGTLCLVHEGSRSLLLARLQPLRLLHPVYCVFLLALGAWLAADRMRVISLAPVAIAAGSLLLMQRALYGFSDHLELPGRAPRSGYAQAFLWVRDHTPPDALFALDADYTRAPGEDAQLFRAVALRSSLPDAAKDGGIASMMPVLAPEWLRASEAQQGLAAMTDAERVRRVRPLGVTWIVLPAASTTGFDCPYRNAVAQVCKLP